jgi:hypothetical protein
MEGPLSRRVVSGAPEVTVAAARRARARPLPRSAEAVALVGMLALAVLARRPGYLLRHSFWLDEGWVVDSVRAPFGQLKLLTSSTPIGWTLLLRAVPPLGGPERYRLLPLTFGVATVPLAWVLARRLGRWGMVRAAVAAAAAALVPVSLARHDLKQYSAEGFVAVGALLLVAWVEEGWSRRRLAVLALFGAASVLVANTAPLVVLGGLGALVLTSAARRRWRHAGEAAAAAVAAVAVHLLVYVTIAGAGDNPAMRHWWLRDYIHLDGGLGAAARFVGGRAAAMLASVGFGPWWLALALVAGGVWSLARAGRPAAALLLPVLAVELVVAAAAQRYPLLEARTSLFVAVTLAVYAALGVGELMAMLLERGWTAPLALGVAAGVAALLIPAAAAAARKPMPSANVREQLAVVQAHWRPDDAVVVNGGGTFSFAYYWPDRPTFVRTTENSAVNFMVTYPDHPALVMVHGGPAGIVAAMARAHANGGRIWVVFAHGGPATIRRWSREAARHGRIAHPGPKAFPLLVQPPPDRRRVTR